MDGTRSLACCSQHVNLVPISITRSSKTAGAEWYWKYAPGDTMVEGLGRKRGKRRKACGTIHCPLHRGNGEDGRRNIMDSTLHDIVNGVMIMSVHVERMADAQP